MTEKAFNQIKEGLEEAAEYARRDVANTSMVERVARAISGAPFPSKASMRKARAAIEAMNVPTEGMVEAVGRDIAVEPDIIVEIYRAMNDAALRENPGGTRGEAVSDDVHVKVVGVIIEEVSKRYPTAVPVYDFGRHKSPQAIVDYVCFKAHPDAAEWNFSVETNASEVERCESDSEILSLIKKQIEFRKDQIDELVGVR